MRDKQPLGEIAAAFAELLKLEEQFAANAAEVDPDLEPRVYDWYPTKLPELPAIWNWIDDGTYDIVDIARADDLLVMRTTIGVKPNKSSLGESMNQLVALMDIFRATVDPAFAREVQPGQPRLEPLGGTVRTAKRVVTQQHIEEWGGIPVMCLSTLVRLQLSAQIK